MIQRDIRSASAFSQLTDEELIVQIRGGREAARDALFERYHHQRAQRIKSAIMPTVRYVSEWSLGEIYFRALCRASLTYRFGEGAMFSTYFSSVLKRELVKADARELRRYETKAVRLDAPFIDEQSDSMLLAERICPDESENDPRSQVFYAKLGDALKVAPPKCNPKVLDVVRLLGEGYSLAEISMILKVKVGTIRVWIDRLRESLVRQRYKKRTRPGESS